MHGQASRCHTGIGGGTFYTTHAMARPGVDQEGVRRKELTDESRVIGRVLSKPMGLQVKAKEEA